MAKGKYQSWLTDDGLLRIEGWARDRLTDEQISKNIGIRSSTFYDWIKKYPEISEALKKGKAPVDVEVENALYKSACGFVGPDDKFYPPNMTAAIFWLKNRLPQKWRNNDKETPKADEERQVRIEMMRAKTDLMTGNNMEIEDMEETDGMIYGDES